MGNLIWQRSYPSSDDRFFHSIVEAFDGGYILAGDIGFQTRSKLI
jgi:hypothetical protein